MGDSARKGVREAAQAGRRLVLPEHRTPVGPITARLQRRWTTGYAVVWALSLAVLTRKKSDGARTAAAGIMVPGGGYLYTGRRGPLGLTLLGVVAGFFAWFAVGMMFAPFTVWAAAAGLAARRAAKRPGAGPAPAKAKPNTLAVAVAGPAVLAATAAARRRAFGKDRRRGYVQNAKLAATRYTDPTPQSSGRGAGELTPDQLAYQRFILDRALQPPEAFDGFEWFDQFREAAVRYQLNYGQWALALAQYRCTPAFSGYVAEAQRRLIEKMTARPVWEYWRWENLWGNFRLDPDPIRRDNVMLSGYYGVMLAAYQDVTGDDRYDQPGCLTFRWNDRKAFPYDAGSIARAVAGNMGRAGYCMFPCEPNWVYSICNAIAMVGLVGYDRLHGTGHATPLLPRFREAFELEFSKADGRPVTIRASRAGISVPGLAASTANETGVAFWLSPTMHDVATRSWLLTRDHVVGSSKGKPGPVFQSPVDKMDLGSYRLSWGPVTYGLALAAAREMGDDEACASLEESLAEVAAPTVTDGVLAFPGTTTANLMMGLGILGGRRAWHDLVAYGTPAEQHARPVLAEAPYPEVLVARAVTDGDALDLVLYPGAGGEPVTLGFDRLVPGRSYLVKQAGETFTADDRGRGSVTIRLEGRTEVTVAP